jgi:hypothetical protein
VFKSFVLLFKLFEHQNLSFGTLSLLCSDFRGELASFHMLFMPSNHTSEVMTASSSAVALGIYFLLNLFVTLFNKLLLGKVIYSASIHYLH